MSHTLSNQVYTGRLVPLPPFPQKPHSSRAPSQPCLLPAPLHGFSRVCMWCSGAASLKNRKGNSCPPLRKTPCSSPSFVEEHLRPVTATSSAPLQQAECSPSMVTTSIGALMPHPPRTPKFLASDQTDALQPFLNLSALPLSVLGHHSLTVFVRLLPVVAFSLFQCCFPKSRLSPLICADDRTISCTLLCADDFHNHISSTDLSPELQARRSNSLPDIST